MNVQTSSFSTPVMVLAALCGFAANSVFCRLALASQAIDPASFTTVRLLSGAITLALLWLITPSSQSTPGTLPGSWRSACALFVYAVGFSYAYVWLDTGTGALILFASVQLSMLLTALYRGERFSTLEKIGLACAFGGFVYLVMPGVAAPDAKGAALMVLAGIAWAVYTLRGKGSNNPLHDTAGNFIRTLPMLGLLAIPLVQASHLSMPGVFWACASGVLASAIGYAIWYKVLPRITTTVAAVSQLSVPVIAGMAGVVWLNEAPGWRLVLASMVILGGIAMVVEGQKRARLA